MFSMIHRVWRWVHICFSPSRHLPVFIFRCELSDALVCLRISSLNPMTGNCLHLRRMGNRPTAPTPQTSTTGSGSSGSGGAALTRPSKRWPELFTAGPSPVIHCIIRYLSVPDWLAVGAASKGCVRSLSVPVAYEFVTERENEMRRIWELFIKRDFSDAAITSCVSALASTKSKPPPTADTATADTATTAPADSKSSAIDKSGSPPPPPPPPLGRSHYEWLIERKRLEAVTPLKSRPKNLHAVLAAHYNESTALTEARESLVSLFVLTRN